VQENRKGQVPTCGVAANNHVGRVTATFSKNVPEGFDGLAELRWVFSRRRKGVGEEEDGDIVSVLVELLDQAAKESEVSWGWGQDKTAAFVLTI
jgi:hypothetical protein